MIRRFSIATAKPFQLFMLAAVGEDIVVSAQNRAEMQSLVIKLLSFSGWPRPLVESGDEGTLLIYSPFGEKPSGRLAILTQEQEAALLVDKNDADKSKRQLRAESQGMVLDLREQLASLARGRPITAPTMGTKRVTPKRSAGRSHENLQMTFSLPFGEANGAR